LPGGWARLRIAKGISGRLSPRLPPWSKTVAKAAVLITYREILGKEPELPALHKILKKYERREVIFLLAKVNCLLGTWQNAPYYELDERFSNYLLGDFHLQLKELRRASDTRVVFSRFTLLYLIKQACIACPEKGAQVNTRRAHSEIGICCLMANDLVLPFVPKETDGTLERLTNLLPFSDYVSQEHYSMEIGRTQIILDEILKLPLLAARSDFVDIEVLFQKYLGLDLRTFCELSFGCSSKFIKVKLEELEANPETAVLRSSYFAKSKIPSDKIAQFFSKTTITESSFVDKVDQSKDRPRNDLTVFQAFPLIEIANEVFACLDPGFIIDKAGRGLYWTLFFALPDEHRGKLASFWGAVFELYINYVLSKSYEASGIFFSESKFSNGDGAFDAFILEGRNFIVFEHKSSVIRADAKYAGDPSKLKKELDLKFIEGDTAGSKGLGQLSKHLARFLGGDKLGDLSCANVDKVYPVLVCLESTMVTPYLGRYLNERFRTIFRRRDFRQVVTPVFTLGVSDIENLLGYLQSFLFSAILESYHSKNKTMLTSISSSEVPLLKYVKPQRNIAMERFSEFSEIMVKDLFGDMPEDSV